MRNVRQQKRKKETHQGDGWNNDGDNRTTQRDLEQFESVVEREREREREITDGLQIDSRERRHIVKLS